MSNFNYNEFAMEDAWKAYLEDVLSFLKLDVLLGSEFNTYAEKCVAVRCPDTIEPPELNGTATNVTTVDVSVITATSVSRADHVTLVGEVMDRVFDDTLVTALNAKSGKLVCQRVERLVRTTRIDEERSLRITTQRVQILCSMDG